MNAVVVSTHRRPFQTRLCLESLARAQAWFPWADYIAICISPNGDPTVASLVVDIVEHFKGTPFSIWNEPVNITNPHDAAKWMLDTAFAFHGISPIDMVLYVEDDAFLSPDAFAMCAKTQLTATRFPRVCGCCCYHESIPAQYAAEGRSPDYRLLNLGNGINTCGGTAFLRGPYEEFFAPQWNLKKCSPGGFDYSLHYLMYVHDLYVVWPDVSRSFNLGFSLGSLGPIEWRKYFGRSLMTGTKDAVKWGTDFRLTEYENEYPPRVREEWMLTELEARGLA